MQASVEQETMVLKDLTAFVGRYHTYDVGMPLIIRPHPGEEIDYWNSLAEQARDVRVIREGDSISWILASRAVISNNCTSSVEATLLGRKTINYRPFVNEVAEYPLPRLLGKQVFSEADLVRELKNIEDKGDPADIDKLTPYISRGVENSAQRLVKSFDALLEENKLTRPAALKEKARLLGGIFRTGANKAKVFFRTKPKLEHRLQKQKFPGIVPGYLDQVREHFIRSGLSNERVQFEWLSDDLVKIYSRP
jgi:hypothetical protein